MKKARLVERVPVLRLVVDINLSLSLVSFGDARAFGDLFKAPF